MPRRFSNLDPSHRPNDMKAIFRWAVVDRLLRRRTIHPPGPPAPRVEPDLATIRAPGGPPRLTWIGHASFLATVDGRSLLLDPVFSPRVGWVVPRHSSPGLRPADLPSIDALLVTHCHYDHLDKASVTALPRSVPVFVPLCVGRWFRRWGFTRVTELDWWESSEIDGLRITLVPTRHWSRRWLHDVNRTLWGGFVVEGPGVSICHIGDSAWFDGFREIGRRFPELSVALLPIGAYAPAWFMENHHMNPEQAGQAFLDLGARRLLPMHWGCFKLTDEPLREPLERLQRWWRANDMSGRRLVTPAVGETVSLDD